MATRHVVRAAALRHARHSSLGAIVLLVAKAIVR